jgi:predicted TIM-barrel fold metal-dependent hydrolase
MKRPKLLRSLCGVLGILPVCAAYGQTAPLVDHHQHLFSPAIAALISEPPPAQPVKPIDARDLVSLLDAAGIQRAVVLSVAYMFGSPNRTVENEY